jgi:hypothetical protein
MDEMQCLAVKPEVVGCAAVYVKPRAIVGGTRINRLSIFVLRKYV